MKDHTPDIFWIVSFLILLLFAVVAFADETCHWQACSIIQGQLSVCGSNVSGSPDLMLTAEKASRHHGELFMRECSTDGKTEIDWHKGDKAMFMRPK